MASYFSTYILHVLAPIAVVLDGNTKKNPVTKIRKRKKYFIFEV